MNRRLVLLHQTAYDIPGSNITILGCTLWSRIPDTAEEIVRSKIQDFKKIQDWTTADRNVSHEVDLTWLLNEIKTIQQKQKCSILIVSHHAPSLQNTSSPQHANNPWSCAFGTDILSQIADLSAVKAWIFGHAHYSTEFRERGGGWRISGGYVLPWNKAKQSKDGFDIGNVIHV